MKNNYLVIMAGGIGSRFWPMSTENKPKQFLDVLGLGETLLQQTVRRFSSICKPEHILIVTSANYKELVQEQCPQLLESNILLEPCMRNTAPCIAYASYKIKKENPEANIIVAPSDHLITNETEFVKIITEGLAFTQSNDALLTLGILPHKPETGYGYIQANKGDVQPLKVEAFKEKPNLETAKEYVEAGNFYWNSGIFIWSLKSIISAFESYLPKLSELFEKGETFYNTPKEQDFINTEFPTCENISVDYGIMENAQNIYVQPADFGWSDLGTWGSLWEQQDKDMSKNAVVGENVHLFEVSNSVIHVPNDKKVVIQGLDNCIIVEENGTLLICKKEEEQRIKEFKKVF